MRVVILTACIAMLASCGGDGAFQTVRTERYLEICSDPESSAEEALRFCTRALDNPGLDDRNRALIQMNIGTANTALGRHRDAVAAHSRALELSPGLAGAHLGRAEARQALGEARGALSDYNAAIGADPKVAEAWFGRGVLYRKAGQAEKAVRDLERALLLRPRWPAAQFERGSALYALERYAEAEAAFSQVLRQTPDDAAARLNRAQTRVALGDPAAGADFDSVIAAEPEWGRAYVARADWHEAAGRQDAANADYLRAFELGVTDPALIARVRRLSGG